MPDPKSIKDTDDLYNIACFFHLKELLPVLPKILDNKSLVQEIKDNCQNFNSKHSYGNLYHKFFIFLGKLVSGFIDKLERAKQEDKGEEVKNITPYMEELYVLVLSCYLNLNPSLEYVFDVIEPIVEDVHQTSEDIEDIISYGLEPKKNLINSFNPTYAGSLLGRLQSTTAGYSFLPAGLGLPFLNSYMPQTETNVPQIRKYTYKEGLKLPIEFRSSTQAEYFKKKARINPIFDFFLYAYEAYYSNKGITHVYFNYLELVGGNNEADWERDLSLKLHELEDKHPNIIVINMPLMIASKEEKSAQQFKDRLFDDILYDKENFKFSQKAKEKLFSFDVNNIEAARKDLDKLYESALSDLGYSQHETLSEVEQQALSFHFINYTLTEHTLQKFDPISYQKICKDGIDRGGVSSLYYNLIKSIKLGNPLSKQEFLKGLHAAPTLVKGRGVNKHSKKLWCALSAFSKNNQVPEWLTEWLASNDPKSSTKHRLLSKLEQDCKDKDTESLITLYGEIESIPQSKHKVLHNYSELARTKTLISGKYSNDFGYTRSIEKALNIIKKEIINQGKIYADPKKNSEIMKILEKHTNPYILGCFGKTNEQYTSYYEKLIASLDVKKSLSEDCFPIYHKDDRQLSYSSDGILNK
ncbi:hypothetical protein L3V86_05680 [Thiotrichales bacterium 19S11-10]|nr:hypothetical protein [Thiotrichales bacterium 19S11-10]